MAGPSKSSTIARLVGINWNVVLWPVQVKSLKPVYLVVPIPSKKMRFILECNLLYCQIEVIVKIVKMG